MTIKSYLNHNTSRWLYRQLHLCWCLLWLCLNIKENRIDPCNKCIIKAHKYYSQTHDLKQKSLRKRARQVRVYAYQVAVYSIVFLIQDKSKRQEKVWNIRVLCGISCCFEGKIKSDKMYRNRYR